MKIINGWNSSNKQIDKFEFIVRFGWITIAEIYCDVSDKKWRVGIFNFAAGN